MIFPPRTARAAGTGEPLDLLRRRIPQFVLGALVAGGALLGGVDQLTQHAVLPEISYRFALLLVVHGVVTTGVFSWFHGARGRQRVKPLEALALAAVALSWIGWSVWTLMTFG